MKKKKKLIPTKRKKVNQAQINERVTAELIEMINNFKKSKMNNLNTFEECCEYLNIPTDLPKCHIREKQIQSAYKLSVCMLAWNKEDGFELDENAIRKQKNEGYSPYFDLKNGKLLSSGSWYRGSYTGLVSAGVDTSANYGIRLCLSTEKRAVDFGQLFIDIYNELL